MFLACYPMDVTCIPNMNLNKISNLCHVKGTTTRILSYNLPEDVSYWIHRFVQSRPMREWTNPNTFFGFKDVQSLDVELSKFAVRAGYPSNYFFTSYSLRRGKINQDVGDLILLHVSNILLHGYSRERAVRTVKSGMGWAIVGDTIEMYITPLVNKCLEIVENGEEANTIEMYITPLVNKCLEIVENGEEANYSNGVDSRPIIPMVLIQCLCWNSIPTWHPFPIIWLVPTMISFLVPGVCNVSVATMQRRMNFLMS
jgi:hypothetical protein